MVLKVKILNSKPFQNDRGPLRLSNGGSRAQFRVKMNELWCSEHSPIFWPTLNPKIAFKSWWSPLIFLVFFKMKEFYSNPIISKVFFFM